MTQQQLIAQQRRSLLIFAQRHNITKACQVFGISRTTFYNIKKQFIKTGSLEPRIRRKPRMPNEASLRVKKLLLKIVQQYPGCGSSFYAYELRQHGIHITQQGVWYCLKRFGLNNRYKRLVYIEELATHEQPLTERSLKQLKRTFSEIKRGAWPGHVVALDTFCVGSLKGIGRIYQLTGIDLCSRFGWAHLYTDKSAASAVGFVEQCLIPTFYTNGIAIESVLTDNGTEFVNSSFRDMVTSYDITHYRIPRGKPLMNGYCERFQRTIHEEFYQPVFRRKFFASLEDLTQELTRYLVHYNFKRPHFGVIATGAIPADVLKLRSTILRKRFSKLLT